jgi:hypothetical protein
MFRWERIEKAVYIFDLNVNIFISCQFLVKCFELNMWIIRSNYLHTIT